MMIDFSVIEPAVLCEEEKRQLAMIMATGNILLKQYHEKAFAFKGCRSEFRKELFKSTKKGSDEAIRIGGALIWSADLKKIKEVEKNQYRILQGISSFMLQLSKKWKSRTKNSIAENYDEAITIAINCIHCYTDTTIKFCTYAGNAINKHFISLRRINQPLSHWTNNANQLYGQYEKCRQVAEQEKDKEGNPVGTLTFDQIVKKMKLTKEEISCLSDMFSHVVNSNEMGSGEESGAFDYTSFRQGIDNRDDFLVEPDLKEMIAKVSSGLDTWEKAVLKAFLESDDDHGWRTIVAGENINPITGKNYTRAAPVHAFERVKEKFRQEYAA